MHDNGQEWFTDRELRREEVNTCVAKLEHRKAAGTEEIANEFF